MVKYRIILLVSFFLSLQTTYAGVETFSARAVSSTGGMDPSGSIQVTEDKFGLLPTADFVNHKVNDYIIIGVDHANLTYVSADYNLDFYLRYKWKNAAGTVFTDSVVLNVAYDADAATPYNDKSVFKFTGGHSFVITIDSIKDDVGAIVTTAPANLFMETIISVERYYDFSLTPLSPADITKNTVNLDALSDPDELQLSWPYMEGAEEYELEWTFVNDYRGNGGYIAGLDSLDYDFKNNSTRVVLSDNHYNISLVFEHGYLLYRIRGVGRKLSDPGISLYGEWSMATAGTVDDISASNNYYQVTTPHQHEKNWQYSATYAEEGKKKEAVSYFDGSLRNRQTVSKINTEGKAIVGETIYDHEGRGAVQVLPAPVDTAALKFYTSFSLSDVSSGGTLIPYSRLDFDTVPVGDSCSAFAQPMSDLNGASRYYSPNNPDQAGHQAYVPDAEKYPFTRVEYTNDNTGRIRRQSGVGEDHRLDSGHETKYFYGKPHQEELDKLFGSEAGYSSHYKKNMVIDANGQISVSYLDQQGRVVATSLAGHSSVNTDSLSSSVSAAVATTADLLAKDRTGKSTANRVNIGRDAIIYTSNILVSTAGPHEFTYDITAPAYKDACTDSANLCFECVYSLEISVTDACGREMLPGGVPLKTNISGDTLASALQLNPDTLCDNPNLYFSTGSLVSSLPVGNYTVTKKLTINDSVLDYYASRYLDTSATSMNTCLRPLQNFIDSALAHIDTTACKISCAECEASLGIVDTFLVRNPGTTTADFNRAVQECREPCQATSICEATYGMLLSDVSPGGQYAEYRDAVSGAVSASFPLSLFNANNSLAKNYSAPGTAYFRNPIANGISTRYKNPDGSDSRITVYETAPGVYSPAVYSTGSILTDTDGSLYIYPDNLLNITDFVSYWQSGWATYLVEYHPEYCYYTWCKSNVNSAAFDSLMYVTETYAAAVSAGLIDATTVTPLTSDPYFNSEGGVSQYSQMASRIADYSGGESMKDVVSISYRCGTCYYQPSYTSPCTGSFGTGVDSLKNLDWQMFRALYMGERSKLMQKKADEVALTNKCYNTCIGEKNFNPFTGGMMNKPYSFSGAPFFDQQQTCNAYVYTLYKSKQKRFINNNNLINLGTDVNDTLLQPAFDSLQAIADYEAYLETGQCPLAIQLQTLVNKLNTTGEIVATADLDEYVEFTPGLYKNIAGTPGTCIAYDWDAAITGDTALTADIENGGTPDCFVNLKFSNGSIYHWNNTFGSTYRIGGLHALRFIDEDPSGTFNFTMVAFIDTVIGGVQVRLDTVLLHGSTCVEIGGCTFPGSSEKCEPSQLALDLQNLMTAVTVGGDLFSSNEDLTAANYNPFLTTALKAQLGASSTYEWTRTGAFTYLVGTDDMIACNNKGFFISLTGGGVTESEIEYFTSIVPDPASGVHSFKITVWWDHDSNGGTPAVPVVLPGNIFSYCDCDGNGLLNFFDVPCSDTINMGSCCSRVPIECQTIYHETRSDLQSLLNDLTANNNLLASDHDLTVEPAYVNLLASYLNFANPVWNATVTSASDDTLTGYITPDTLSPACTVKLWFNDTNHTFNFADIQQFIDLKTDYSQPTGGQYYHFIAVVRSASSYDTLHGYSTCFPIKNCDNYVENISNVYTYDFENFTSGSPGFTTDLTYVTSCPFGIVGFGPQYYSVTKNASALCGSGFIGLDHTTPPSGNFMLLYSADLGIGFPSPSVVWSSTLSSVTTQTNYKFSAWYMIPLTSISGNDNYYIDLLVNDTIIKSVTADINTPTGVWNKIEGYWNSSMSSGPVVLKIKGMPFQIPISTIGIAIDDISFDKYDITACPSPIIPASPSLPYDTMPRFTIIDPCVKYLQDVATANATEQWKGYMDSLNTAFREAYIAKCLAPVENFDMQYTEKEYHYTLYYYDQGGNLARTVPPEGVSLVDLSTGSAAIHDDRVDASHTFFTEHDYLTTYQYNSLNQLIRQSTPDADNMNRFDLTASTGLPSGLGITSMQFTGSGTGYLTGNIGGNGVIYVTNDGGQTWTQLSAIGAVTLNKVQMVSATVGFAVGNDGKLLTTIDGGSTWNSVITGTTSHLKDLYFSSATNGVIVGNNGTARVTANAGASWVQATGISTAANLTAVSFGSSTIGYATAVNNGVGVVYTTANGGLTWVKQNSISAADLSSVHMVNATTGFASGVDGSLIKTTDGGNTWYHVGTGITNDFVQVHFSGATNGTAILDNGDLYYTTNGGDDWTLALAGSYNRFNFYSATNGYAVGAGGTVAKTTNTGASWTAATSVSGSPTLNDASFISSTTGYVAGNSNALHYTTNGGTSWTAVTPSSHNWIRVHVKDINTLELIADNGEVWAVTAATTSPSSSDVTPGAFNFIDHSYTSVNNGYVIAETGEVFPTTDGGQTWGSQFTNDAPITTGNITAINAQSSALITAVSDAGGIFITGDEGATAWADKTNATVALPLTDVSVPASSSTAYATGHDGTLLKTTDAGATWKLVSTGTAYDLNTTLFSSSTTGIIAGNNGTALRTTDAGSSFSTPSFSAGTIDAFKDITQSGSDVYITGANARAEKSTNNGANFTTITPSTSITTANLNGVAVVSGSDIITVGDGGTILTYNGSTWANVTNITPPLLNASHHVPGTQVGYSVGDGGAIVKTTDGGASWNTLTSGTATNLNGVHFISGSTGFVVGAGGLIRTTTDGGDNWSTQTSGTASDLNDVWFTDATHGYAVGNGGVILTYNGSTWSAPSSGTSNHLYAVHVINNVGYASGATGTIVKTITSGASWATLTSGVSDDLNDIYFRDYQTGHAIGDNGTLIKTVDGGTTWQPKTTGTSDDLNAIAFGSTYGGFIGGADGTGRVLDDMSDLFGSMFWYDELGRLIVSQNGKQFNKSPKAYSYTKYDELGRISEVGEIATNTDITTIANNAGQVPTAAFTTWLTTGAHTEITNTTYDVSAGVAGFTQENLRTRVSYVSLDEDGNTVPESYSYFSYDIHGNVKSLLQNNVALAAIGQQYKRIDYDYDLISGGVKALHYQSGEPDQYHHYFEYDADNKIANVHTSIISSEDEKSLSMIAQTGLSDQDAKYFYYQHGLLARAEIGDNKVQAMDYAYTIQGWAKGMNSNVLAAANDIGKDASLTVGNLNRYVARDAAGYSLSYFDDDYNPIATLTNNFIASTSAITNLPIEAPSLFNGNVNHMVTSITDPVNGGAIIPQLTAYKYDQLNRIKQMMAYRDINLGSNAWNSTQDNSYKTNVTYDANGNILSMQRNGLATTDLNMDVLTYKYEIKTNGFDRNSNRLSYVEDAISSVYNTDIDNQSANNYNYDEIGNLVKDSQEEIDTITWTVYGKVKTVVRTSVSSKPDLEFRYDAIGNRIAKIVKPHATLNDTDTWTTIYYINDAGGNILSTYKDKENDSGFYLQEHNIYGSSRLGIKSYDLDLTSIPLSDTITRRLGAKNYEITNHLGNVLTTVSDQPIPHNNSGTIDYFIAKITSTFDYGVWGDILVGNRSYSTNVYRYGFNGMEKDDEMFGVDGSSYTTFERQYNSRLGRWMSKDPVGGKFPWQSPYAGNDNKPIIRSDENGDCPTCITGAIIGAFTELVVQVGDQMLQGKDFSTALAMVDKTDVAAAAIAGGVSGIFTGGADKLVKLFSDPKYKKVAGVILETAADYLTEIIQSAGEDVFNDDFEFSSNYFKDLLADAGVATAAGKITTIKTDTRIVTPEMVKNAEKKLVKAEKTLEKATKNSQSTEKAAKKVLEAKKDVVQHKVADKVQQTAGKVKEETVEQIAENVSSSKPTNKPVGTLTYVPGTNNNYAKDTAGNLFKREGNTKIFRPVEKIN